LASTFLYPSKPSLGKSDKMKNKIIVGSIAVMLLLTATSAMATDWKNDKSKWGSVVHDPSANIDCKILKSGDGGFITDCLRFGKQLYKPASRWGGIFPADWDGLWTSREPYPYPGIAFCWKWM